MKLSIKTSLRNVHVSCTPDCRGNRNNVEQLTYFVAWCTMMLINEFLTMNDTKIY
jgi:hypothetical protein